LLASRRYETTDTSRNNWLLALGEEWHNNHHHFMASARQGSYWWEIDITYYALKMLSWCGLVWDLRNVPAHLLADNTLAA
jgi:stearoyl-CoA desaturase (delta-9 desaturase)